MPFDPSQPFEEVPTFDPGKPFEQVAFDPSQPFEPVSEGKSAPERILRNVAAGTARQIASVVQGIETVPSYKEAGREWIKNLIPALREPGTAPLIPHSDKPFFPTNTLSKAAKVIRDAADNRLAVPTPANAGRVERFLTETLPGAAGSMIGMVGEAAALKKVPVIGRMAKASEVATGTIGALSGAGDAFQDAKDHGADDETALSAALVGAGMGATEIVPIAKWLSGNGAGRVLGRAIREGTEEGVQEFFQQLVNNAWAQKHFDPTRPWLQGAGESTAAGVTLGTIGSLLASAVHAKLGKVRPAAAGKPDTQADKEFEQALNKAGEAEAKTNEAKAEAGATAPTPPVAGVPEALAKPPEETPAQPGVASDDIVLLSSFFPGLTPSDRTVGKADLPTAETAAKTTWFHGTGVQDLDRERIDTIGHSEPEGLVGMGFYLTDDPSVAESYATRKGKKTGTPTVYEVSATPRSVLNYEDPLPANVGGLYLRMAQAFDTSFDTAAVNAVEQALKTNKPGMAVHKALAEELRGIVPWSESVEIFQNFQSDLRGLGYDAITHIGGLRQGKGRQHRVMVLLDPADVSYGKLPNTIAKLQPVQAPPTYGSPIFPGVPPPGQDVRRFMNQVAEDPSIPDLVKGKIANQFYQRMPNEETEAWAKRVYQEAGGPDAARNIFNSKDNDLPEGVRTALGHAITRGYLQELTLAKGQGNNAAMERAAAKAAEFLDEHAERGTELGRGVQQFSVFKGFEAPEVAVSYYRKAIRKMQDWARGKIKAVLDMLRAEVVPMAPQQAVPVAPQPSAPLTPEAVPPAATPPTQPGISSDDVALLSPIVPARRAPDPTALDRLVGRAEKMVPRSLRKRVPWKKLIEHLRQNPNVSDETVWNAIAPRLGLPTFKADVAAEVAQMSERIARAPEGKLRNREIVKLMDRIAQEQGDHVGELLWSLWYNRMLSGPMTHALNLTSNAMQAGSSALMAAAQRPQDIPALARALAYGLYKSLPEIAEVVQTGRITGVRMLKAEPAGVLERTQRGGLWKLLKHWRMVARTLAAEDLAFFMPLREMRMMQLSRELARRQGLRGAGLEAEVDRMMGQTPEQVRRADEQARSEGLTGRDLMQRRFELIEMERDPRLRESARDYALRNTFNSKPYGVIGLGSRSLKMILAGVPAFRIVVPFVDVVGNVLNESINYSPLAAKRWYDAYRHNQVFGREAEFGDVFELYAKGAAGLTLTAALAALFASQYELPDDQKTLDISGPGPEGRDRKRQLALTGWKPFSIKVGDRWIPFNESQLGLVLGPIGMYMDALRYRKLGEKSTQAKLFFLGEGILSYALNRSALKNAADLVDALGNPAPMRDELVSQALARPIAGLVTSRLVSQVDRMLDPTIYDSSSNFMAALQAQVGIVRRWGRPALNVFGEPVKLHPAERFVSPVKPDRLAKVLADKDIWIPVQTGEQLGGANFEPFTADEIYEFHKLRGPMLRKILEENLKEIEAMPAEQAKAVVSRIVSGQTLAARMEVISRRKPDPGYRR